MEQYSPYVKEDIELQLSQVPSLAILRAEGLSQSLNLTMNGPIGALYKEIRDRSGSFGHFIDTWAESPRITFEELMSPLTPETTKINDHLIEICQNLKIASQKASAYQDFVEAVAAISEDVSDQMKTAFLSTMQNYYNYHPDFILNNHHIMEEIFDKIDLTIRSLHLSDKYNADMMRGTIADWGC